MECISLITISTTTEAILRDITTLNITARTMDTTQQGITRTITESTRTTERPITLACSITSTEHSLR